MTRRRLAPLAALLLFCALLAGGCAPAAQVEPSPAPGEAQRYLEPRLGRLAGLLSPREREQAMTLAARLLPLRQARLEAGIWAPSPQEARLLVRLNRLYERCTRDYLGEGDGWDGTAPAERTLAQFRILSGRTLDPLPGFGAQADYAALFARMTAMLPEGAFGDFTRFTVFTDGPDETLAYAAPLDAGGSRWEIAVDPADAGDGDWFTQTVLHEYCHYLTLNGGQVRYTGDQTTDTYNEPGMVCLPGSYLDDFYQAFWTGYLDDRLANPDSCGFFLRHEEDFLTGYAAADPAEDVAESFAWFVLSDPPEDGGVRAEKYRFFYAYPELVRLRGGIRARLGLD